MYIYMNFFYTYRWLFLDLCGKMDKKTRRYIYKYGVKKVNINCSFFLSPSLFLFQKKLIFILYICVYICVCIDILLSFCLPLLGRRKKYISPVIMKKKKKIRKKIKGIILYSVFFPLSFLI